MDGTIRCWLPLLLPGASSGSGIRLGTPRGEATANPSPSEDKRPSTGLASSPVPFLSLSVSEYTLPVCVFLCFFFGTGGGNQCREKLSAEETLGTDANVLGAKSE